MLSDTQVHITSGMYYMKDKATHGVQLQKNYTEKILDFMQYASKLINFPVSHLVPSFWFLRLAISVPVIQLVLQDLFQACSKPVTTT